ncbi:MAG: SDR family NAD(P)-dependent oxidoreductase [Dehalococcoidia bacterium]
MADELAGKVALVTGGGRGIGRAIALRFAEAGAAVGITSRTPEQVDETAALLREMGAKYVAVVGDVAKPEDVQRVVEATERELGPVDIMVNNAGITGPYGPIWEVDAEHWLYTQQVHLGGAFLFTRAVMPGMIERGGGRIITIVSGAGLAVRPFFSGYATTKAAQIRFMEHVAAEGGDRGIVGFAMSPGLVYTELAASTVRDPAAQKWMPQFVERLNNSTDPDLVETSMSAVTDLALALATGHADVLNGQHVSPADDLEALIAKAAATS